MDTSSFQSYDIRMGPLSAHSLSPYTSFGAGLRDLLNNSFTKVLVEVITYYDGRYGRFLVLVYLGVGCTVWYDFAFGSAHQAPEGWLLAPFGSYERFFDMDYYAPGYRRVGFVEGNDVSALVESAFGNEHPFTEITIPSSGPVLKAVGLGVMVAFFLAVGLVPDVSCINVQL
ncbi:hypothetical protein AAC387_Pa11g0577 [Persea americana]